MGGPLTRALNSDQAAEAILLAGRAVRTGVGAANAVAGRAVHLLSLPSRRDVQRVEIRVARLDRAIQELGQRLEEQGVRTDAGERR